MSDPYERRIGEYCLIRKLGGGGFGTVHLAEHIHEHAPVAIKILQVPLTKSEDLRAFLNETRTMIRLHHSHIIPLLDVGLSSEGFPFLVMEYASEGTLRDRHPKSSQVPLATIAEYIEQMASALQYAHDHRIIHRDIKPENLLLRSDGTLLLSDFGIAKIIEYSTHMSVQKQIGTPAYMAPEQHRGHPCFASDQYALAVVTYEWISGTPPFEGETPYGLAVQHLMVPPPSLLDQFPTLSAVIDQVIFKALSKEPEQRFATVQDFATAFRAAVQEATVSQVRQLPLDKSPSKETSTQQPVATASTHAEPQTSIHPTPPLSPAIAAGKPSRLMKTAKRSPLLRRNLLLLSGALLAGLLILTLVINMTGVSHEPTLNPNTVARLVKKWTFQTGSNVYSSPAVVDSVVYIGSYDNNVYAIDAQSGQQKWAFPTENVIRSSPAVANGIVYISSWDGNMYAIDARSGHKKWAFQTASSKEIFTSSAVVVDGLVYVGSYDGNMYAIDAQSGHKKWAFQTGNAVWSSPTIIDGVIYVGSDDHNIYAIDARSGRQKWVFQTAGHVSSSPAVVDGVVYVGSWDSYVYAIDAQSGHKKWAFQTGDSAWSSPAVVDGVVYASSVDQKVYAIDAQSGHKKWAFQTGGPVYSSPTVLDGVVYVGSYDNNVYAIDAQSGHKKWAFQTGDHVYSSPVVANDVVYIGSLDHYVYAFGLPATAT